jgi:hypothetical protein
MGSLTRSDFREEVRFVCGGIASTAPAITDTIINRRINWSYLWCSMPNHYQHPELEITEQITLVANQAVYTPTVTFWDIVSVSHAEAAAPTNETHRYKLDPISIREQASILRTQRVPRLYSWWNNTIILASVPDTGSVGQQLEVVGYRQPAQLTADKQSTLLRDEWDEIIITGAEWRIWVGLNEHDRAYEAKQNLGQLVNEVADPQRLHAVNEWGWQTGIDDGGPIMRIS